MSNIIPPLLSNSPPPITGPLDEEDDDDFGDFRAAHDLSFSCDNLSLPSSPLESPNKQVPPTFPEDNLDINSNSSMDKSVQDKDFLDRRKDENYVINDEFPRDKSAFSTNSEKATFGDFCNFENIINNPNFSIEKNVIEATESKDVNIKPMQGKSINPNEYGNSSQDINKDQNCRADEICDFEHANAEKSNPYEVSSEKVDKKTQPCIEHINEDTSENVIVNVVQEEDLENPILKASLSDKIVEQSEVTDSDSNNCVNKNIKTVVENGCGDSLSIDEGIKHFSNIAESCQTNVNIEELSNDDNINILKDIKSSHIEKELDNKDIEYGEFLKPPDLAEDSVNNEFGDLYYSEQSNSPGSTEIEICKESSENKEVSDTSNIATCQDHVVDSNHDSENEFGDFETPPILPTSSANEIDLGESSDFVNDDEFGDFATASELKKTEDKFADFSSSSISSKFENFANFDEPESETVVLTLDKENIFEKTETILKDMFPASSVSQNEALITQVTEDDQVFNELKDISETNALAYQWSKSTTQSLLLKSLNIDTRNILYGPAWNPSMPRFAANLGIRPLEPIKPEIITPSPVQKIESIPSSSSQISSSTNVEIPSAQFDWNGSGLINPLDYSQTMLLDLEQLVATLDIPPCNPDSQSNNSSSPNNELDEWDIWLQSVAAKKEQPLHPTNITFEAGISQPNSSSGSNVPTDLINKPEDFDDFHDFTSYQSTEPQTWSNMVPMRLRETHISNEGVQTSNDSKHETKDDFGWLQPTIVTPELPRKDIVDDGDDFDDFQMVLPEKSDDSNSSKILKPVDATPIPTLNNADHIVKDKQTFQIDDFDVLGEFECKPNLQNIEKTTIIEDTISEERNIQKEVEKEINDDEEFTDFHSSAPPIEPIQHSSIKPLQPSILVPQMANRNQSNQINWPDPGITDDDIKRFEISFNRPLEIDDSQKSLPSVTTNVASSIQKRGPEYSPKLTKQSAYIASSKTQQIQSKIQSTKQIAKEKSLDDEEWSDFVSVQQPSPLHKLNTVDRTASPDLPLSVLNLGNLQPVRQPIPIITPHSLVQTKLSSNVTKNSTPNQSNFYPQIPVYQPSIISTQFASQGLYNGNQMTFNNAPSPNFSGISTTSQSTLDDDDWSDFVSSPMPQTNGYHHNKQTLSENSHVQGFTNAAPNIITNPGHFDGFQSGKIPTSDVYKLKNSNVQSKSSISSISSLPDLEFIAPKSWTNRK